MTPATSISTPPVADAAAVHALPARTTSPYAVTSSAIYVGWVRHRRFAPISRAFTFPLYMLYLDLDEIDSVFERTRLWASDTRGRGLALGRFARRDYLGDPSKDLRAEVLDRVEGALGFRPSGPIRLLTHARQYGYVFNPVSFYYCFDRDPDTGEESLASIVGEITNTPWKERHAYVLDCRALSDQSVCVGTRPKRFRFDKSFHVSPFLPMGMSYDWSFSVPCPREESGLGIHMTLRESGEGDSVAGPGTPSTPHRRVFDATLRLKRRPIGRRSLDAMLLRFPFMTARVILGIHWNALILWLRRVPVFPHPARAKPGPSPSQHSEPRQSR